MNGRQLSARVHIPTVVHEMFHALRRSSTYLDLELRVTQTLGCGHPDGQSKTNVNTTIR